MRRDDRPRLRRARLRAARALRRVDAAPRGGHRLIRGRGGARAGHHGRRVDGGSFGIAALLFLVTEELLLEAQSMIV